MIYQLEFVNHSRRRWTFAIWMETDAAGEYDSVAWAAADVAPNATALFDIDPSRYNVVRGSYDSSGWGSYVATSIAPAQAGTVWELHELLQPTTYPAQPDHIIIRNRTHDHAALGIGLDDRGAIFKRDVFPDMNAAFKVPPSRWFAGIFDRANTGEVITDNVILGPFPFTVPFASGNHMRMMLTEVGNDLLMLIEDDVSSALTTTATQYRATGDEIAQRLALAQARG
ncbi:MAG TPA: hypothetical protein VMU84_16200 [Thermoanaerobaculia bacterium]|nr:hypothetical protein [Thermoanaerobaculia bacterium]